VGYPAKLDRFGLAIKLRSLPKRESKRGAIRRRHHGDRTLPQDWPLLQRERLDDREAGSMDTVAPTSLSDHLVGYNVLEPQQFAQTNYQ
jgi:hypothetical protein